VVNAAIALFRKRELPIIQIYHVDRAEGPEPGTEAFEYPASVAVLQSDARVIKNNGDAFNRTDLADILARQKVDTVVLCGLSATACVMATYVGAEDRDLHAYLLRDGVAAGSEMHVRFAEEIFDTLSIGALSQIL